MVVDGAKKTFWSDIVQYDSNSEMKGAVQYDIMYILVMYVYF